MGLRIGSVLADQSSMKWFEWHVLVKQVVQYEAHRILQHDK